MCAPYVLLTAESRGRSEPPAPLPGVFCYMRVCVMLCAYALANRYLQSMLHFETCCSRGGDAEQGDSSTCVDDLASPGIRILEAFCLGIVDPERFLRWPREDCWVGRGWYAKVLGKIWKLRFSLGNYDPFLLEKIASLDLGDGI